ncbi:MAG: sulfite exporter TauE/SafE family protein [Gemmatimonadota bacterium]
MAGAWSYLILFAAGGVAGTLNVVAAGGSMLTLPVLIFVGLPATVANGTNRVAILVQNIGAVWGFHRHRMVEWRWVPWAALPAVAGAAVGAWAAVRAGDRSFERILAAIMVAAVLWSIWGPKRKRSITGPPTSFAGTEATAEAVVWPYPSTSRANTDDLHPPRRSTFVLALFLVGMYGGFVQAGVGFLLLGVAALLGLDFVRGNALKVLVVLAFTPLALALFAASGKVEWAPGFALAAGNFLGGLLGVRLTVLKGHRWIRRVVTATILAFAVALWI